MSTPRTKIRSVSSGSPRTVDQESTPPLKKAATRPTGRRTSAGRTGATTSTSSSGGSPKGQDSDQARWIAWNSRWVRSTRGLIGSLIVSVPPLLIAGIRQVARAASA